MRCPCKNCDHRKLNCHGACEGYKAWRDEKDKANRKKQQEHETKTLSRDHEMKYRKNLKNGWRNR